MKRILIAAAAAIALCGLAATPARAAVTQQTTFQTGSNPDGQICNVYSNTSTNGTYYDCLWDIEGGQVWTQNQLTHNDTNFTCVYGPNSTCQFQETGNTYWCIGWNNAANSYLVEHCVTPIPAWQQFRWGSFTCLPATACQATIYSVYRGHWLYEYGAGDLLGDTSNESLATEWCPLADYTCYS